MLTPSAVVVTMLVTIVAYNFITNLDQLRREIKELRHNGQHPLVGRNVTIVVVSYLVTIAVMFTSYWVYGLIAMIPSVTELIAVSVTTLVYYNLRALIAYLTTWGMWSLFVSIDKKKTKENTHTKADIGIR